MTYLFGQRVVVQGTHILVVCECPEGYTENQEEYVWCLLPAGTPHFFEAHEVKPLPNGQL